MFKKLLLVLMFLIPSLSQALTFKLPEGQKVDTNKVVYINGDITPEMFMDFAMNMILTSPIPGARVVVLNSRGGVVEVGTRMLDMLAMEHNAGVPIVCIAKDDVSSMAFNILSFCDRRYFVKGATSIVHKIRYFELPPMYLTAKNLRRVADDLDKSDELFRQQNAKMMHLTLDKYDDFADKETKWKAEDLFKMGYFDGQVTIENQSGGD